MLGVGSRAKAKNPLAHLRQSSPDHQNPPVIPWHLSLCLSLPLFFFPGALQGLRLHFLVTMRLPSQGRPVPAEGTATERSRVSWRKVKSPWDLKLCRP